MNIFKTFIQEIIQDIKDSWNKYCYEVRNFSQVESDRLVETKANTVWYLDPIRQNHEAWTYWLINDAKSPFTWTANFNKPKGKCPDELKAKYLYVEN